MIHVRLNAGVANLASSMLACQSASLPAGQPALLGRYPGGHHAGEPENSCSAIALALAGWIVTVLLACAGTALGGDQYRWAVHRHWALDA